ncbi:MAG: hypothetical protein RL701_5728 [Pseudomonadota bacterium]
MKRHVLSAALLTVCAAGSALPVHAQQFVLIDTTYTATTANTNDSHYPVDARADIPANWKTPVDYANGKVYVELDILEKPSAVPTLYNICFENSSNYACLPYAPTYTKIGPDDFSVQLNSSVFQWDMVDWTKGVAKVQLILKDEGGTKKQGDPNFYPTKVHVVLTVVAPGSTYMPPSAAGAGGAGSGGGGNAGQAGKAGAVAAAGRSGTGTAGKSGAGAGSSAPAGAGGAGKAGSTASAGNTATGSAGKPSSNAGSLAPSVQGGSSAPAAGSGGVPGNSSSGGTLANSFPSAGTRSVTSELADTGGCAIASSPGHRHHRPDSDVASLAFWALGSCWLLRRRPRV